MKAPDQSYVLGSWKASCVAQAALLMSMGGRLGKRLVGLFPVTVVRWRLQDSGLLYNMFPAGIGTLEMSGLRTSVQGVASRHVMRHMGPQHVIARRLLQQHSWQTMCQALMEHV